MAKLFGGSPSSAMSTQVEKATSPLLAGPDWSSNMEICDIVNTDPGKTLYLVKTLKKRLGNKDPRVQMLTLTLLETVMKNCGDHVHAWVAEKDIPHEMVKLLKKKSSNQVRDRVIELIDSWQASFGGDKCRYSQYWAAYLELRNMGTTFPPRSEESMIPLSQIPGSYPPVFNSLPPVHIYPPPFPPSLSGGYSNYPTNQVPPAAMDSSAESMSLSDMAAARNSVEVLSELLSALPAVDASAAVAVEDELISEMVEQCRAHHARVMNLVNSTGDEELLRQGLALNDELQKVLKLYESHFSASSPNEEESQQGAASSDTANTAGTLAPAAEYRNGGVEAVTAPAMEVTSKAHPPAFISFDDNLSGDVDDDAFGQLAHRSTSSFSSQSFLMQTAPSTAPPPVPLATSTPAPQWSPPKPPVLPPTAVPRPSGQVDNPFDDGNYQAPSFHATPAYNSVPTFSGSSSFLEASPATLQQLYVGNSYVAPWAMPAQPQTQQEQQQSPTLRSALQQSSAGPQTLLHGAMRVSSSPSSPSVPSSTPLLLPPSISYGGTSSTVGPLPSSSPPKFAYGSVDISAALSSLAVNNNGTGMASSKEVPALARTMPQPLPAPLTATQLAKNEDPMSSLFGDLVDLRKSKEQIKSRNLK